MTAICADSPSQPVVGGGNDSEAAIGLGGGGFAVQAERQTHSTSVSQ